MTDTEPPVSKTARKREAERLQQLGARIADLTTEQRASLPLDDDLRHAVDEYLRFTSREARRRQLQRVGRLMRETDITAIEDGLADIDGQSSAARFEFHQLETWRDKLLDEPAQALTDFVAAHPHVDRQQLRHLVRHAQGAKDEQQRKTRARALFRFLREATTEEQPPT